MQLNIGTKIRELRRRDGRTQEALAEFLGVTGQAVSRWESGGSYPDMEMIPSIAHFFHVSIDELFGYDNDREETIQRMVAEAERMMATQGRSVHKGCLPDDFARCLDMLREGTKEFPNEPRIMMELANALHHWGWSQYGGRVTQNPATGRYEEDTAYHAQNEYWQEAKEIYEKLLKCDLDSHQRTLVTFQLVGMYRRTGEPEKAKALALLQNEAKVCQELMLCFATVGEEKARHQAEGLLELLKWAKLQASSFAFENLATLSSEYGRSLILAFLEVYERIFADGRFGLYHYEMGLTYQHLANWELYSGGAVRDVLRYFDQAFDHFNAYVHLCDGGEYAYTAPLVTSLEPVTAKDVLLLDEKIWEMELQDWPEELLSEIRKNPKYSSLFA